MGRLCGTFHFAGPEVFQGGVATDKFDVYSMGIVLWELLNTVATYVSFLRKHVPKQNLFLFSNLLVVNMNSLMLNMPLLLIIK